MSLNTVGSMDTILKDKEMLRIAGNRFYGLSKLLGGRKKTVFLCTLCLWQQNTGFLIRNNQTVQSFCFFFNATSLFF